MPLNNLLYKVLCKEYRLLVWGLGTGHLLVWFGRADCSFGKLGTGPHLVGFGQASDLASLGQNAYWGDWDRCSLDGPGTGSLLGGHGTGSSLGSPSGRLPLRCAWDWLPLRKDLTGILFGWLVTSQPFGLLEIAHLTGWL